MTALIDTNVLLRAFQDGHAHQQAALDAQIRLLSFGWDLVLFPQCLYEFWAAATRPKSSNGLELPPAFVTPELIRLRSVYPMYPDGPQVFAEWERLVTTIPVPGRNSYDARLVAAMMVHGIDHILTFNGKDFTDYPNITVLDPATV